MVGGFDPPLSARLTCGRRGRGSPALKLGDARAQAVPLVVETPDGRDPPREVTRQPAERITSAHRSPSPPTFSTRHSPR